MSDLMNKLLDTNRGAVEHLRATTKGVAEITSPLKSLIDYHTVGYFQIHADGKYMYLCDRTDIPEDIYMGVDEQPEDFKECNRLAYVNGTYETFWEPSNDHIGTKVFQQHGITSSYILYRKAREGVIESFFIDSQAQDMSLVNFVLNNKSAINDFIVYFKEKCGGLIQNPAQSSMAQFQGVEFASQNADDTVHMDGFMDTIKLSKYTMNHEGNGYKLTPKQVEVIEMLSKGYTAKTIAQLLDISPKTVYNHMECLYKKFGVNYKQELIGLYKGSDLQTMRSS